MVPSALFRYQTYLKMILHEAQRKAEKSQSASTS
jgi:hypothetical protein